MRFFSRGWANGDIPGEQAEHISADYRAHLARLGPRLPKPLAQLATLQLHDAIIEGVRLDREQRVLTLSLIGLGDGSAYETIALRYIHYQAHDRILETLKARARDRDTEILYSEVDLDPDGTFVHRLLFWPDSEISLWFEKLEVQVAPRADKRLHLSPAFHEVEPQSD